MSYTKQTWVDGDLITAEKLNHIEDGIANSGGYSIIKVTTTPTTASPYQSTSITALLEEPIDRDKVLGMYFTSENSSTPAWISSIPNYWTPQREEVPTKFNQVIFRAYCLGNSPVSDFTLDLYITVAE